MAVDRKSEGLRRSASEIAASKIIASEARRDRQGRLAVYSIPRGDGGGRYEVAGINERYHPEKARELAGLIKAGKHEQAEKSARDYIIKYTDGSAKNFDNPAHQYLIRDIAFNRGPGGANAAVRMAMGDMPKSKTEAHKPLSAGEIARAQKLAQSNPEKFVGAITKARADYEYKFVGYREQFDKGLQNRWASGQKNAMELLQTPVGPPGAQVAQAAPAGRGLPRDALTPEARAEARANAFRVSPEALGAARFAQEAGTFGQRVNPPAKSALTAEQLGKQPQAVPGGAGRFAEPRMAGRDLGSIAALDRNPNEALPGRDLLDRNPKEALPPQKDLADRGQSQGILERIIAADPSLKELVGKPKESFTPSDHSRIQAAAEKAGVAQPSGVQTPVPGEPKAGMMGELQRGDATKIMDFYNDPKRWGSGEQPKAASMAPVGPLPAQQPEGNAPAGAGRFADSRIAPPGAGLPADIAARYGRSAEGWSAGGAAPQSAYGQEVQAAASRAADPNLYDAPRQDDMQPGSAEPARPGMNTYQSQRPLNTMPDWAARAFAGGDGSPYDSNTYNQWGIYEPPAPPPSWMDFMNSSSSWGSWGGFDGGGSWGGSFGSIFGGGGGG